MTALLLRMAPVDCVKDLILHRVPHAGYMWGPLCRDQAEWLAEQPREAVHLVNFDLNL